MTKMIKYPTLVLSLVLWFGFVPPVGNERAGGDTAQGFVITHPTNSTEEINRRQLKSILKGETVRWPDKKKVVLALMKSNTPLGKVVAEKLLNMSPNDMDQYYLALVFQGKLSAPKTFESAEELKAFVANNPGSVGIIPVNSNPESVKTLKIEGRQEIIF